jgi:hypothetical protein
MTTVYRIQHDGGRIETTTDRRVAASASRNGARVVAATRTGP